MPRANLLFQSYINGQLIGRVLAEAARAGGLSPGEFGFTSAVHAFGPITPTELAAKLGMAPSTLSAHVRRGERRGHVRRHPSATDRRSYELETTAAGGEALRAVFPGLVLAIDAVEAELPRPPAEVRAALHAIKGRASRRHR